MRFNVVDTESSVVGKLRCSDGPTRSDSSLRPTFPGSSAPASKMQLHQRLCHLTQASCRCISCLLSKSVRKRHKKERAAKYRPTRALQQLDADFVGPVTESITGKRFVFLVIDPYSKMRWCVAIRHKQENVGRMHEIISDVRAIWGRHIGDKVIQSVRTDNEPAFAGTPFDGFLKSQSITPLRSAPYTPQLNGTVERAVRDMATSLRAMLLGCDPRLWCFAARHYAMVKNRIPDAKGVSPWVRATRSVNETHRQAMSDALAGKDAKCEPQAGKTAKKEGKAADPIASSDIQRLPFRRFGSLTVCFAEDPLRREGIHKFGCRWLAGVYLGHCSTSSCSIIGLWLKGKFVERRER